MGIFKRVGERLNETPEQLQAQEIRSWCGEVAGVEQIAVCRPRSRQRVAGVVESIKVIPRGGSSTLQVQIYDGTDQIVGIWYGRRKIPGVDLGRRLILEGTIGRFYGNDQLQIINPAYELVKS